MLLGAWSALFLFVFSLCASFALHIEHLADLRYRCIFLARQNVEHNQLVTVDTAPQELNHYFESSTQKLKQQLPQSSNDTIEVQHQPHYTNIKDYNEDHAWILKINNTLLCGVILQKKGTTWKIKNYFATPEAIETEAKF